VAVQATPVIGWKSINISRRRWTTGPQRGMHPLFFRRPANPVDCKSVTKHRATFCGCVFGKGLRAGLISSKWECSRAGRLLLSPPPIDFRLKGPTSIDRSASIPWLAEGGPPIILWFRGRCQTQKDLVSLFESFRSFEAHVAAGLMIIGRGHRKSALEFQKLEGSWG